jgi:serine/threonine-protein kinase
MNDAGAGVPALGPVDPLHALCASDPLWTERYEGWQLLGHGASATVVRARSRALDEDVALKIFQRLDEDGLRRFQQEVRHNQRLASPYVVRTYSPFLRVGLSWLEMEWVDGPDLRHELRRRAQAGQPFDMAEVHALGAALAEALTVAHAAGVVHRDVKPANVLLPHGGRPAAKLGDFGISRVAGAARLTATGLIAGTPQFVAPEVIAGQPADARSDVYSLALVLFQVASGGSFPFEIAADDAPARWLHAHSHLPPRRLRHLAPQVPELLDDLVERALAKRPEARPTASELVALLSGQARPELGMLTLAPVAEPVPTVVSPPASQAATATSVRTQNDPAVEDVGRTLRSNPAPPAAVADPQARRLRRLGLAAGALLALLSAGLWLGRREPTAGPAGFATPSANALSAVERRPAWHLSAAIEGPVLVLVHESGAPLPSGEIVAFDEAGSGHVARLASALGEGEQLSVALDAMEPAFPAASRLARVEVHPTPGPGAGSVVVAGLR